jgi:outer membrane protein TolC
VFLIMTNSSSLLRRTLYVAIVAGCVIFSWADAADGVVATVGAAATTETSPDDESGSSPVGDPVGDVVSLDRLFAHVPDPELNRQDRESARLLAEKDGDKGLAINIASEQEKVGEIRRASQLSLTLEDVIRRTLANNYTIQVVSYNPAVEAARVVEAQSAFDAVFFTNVRKDKVDQPTASQLFATNRDSVSISAGLSKLLPLGATVTGSYVFSRNKQVFGVTNFNTLNPSYSSRIVLDINQPLLRGAGLDYNRSLIVLSKNNRRISDLTFKRQVRDTLREVEELYWRLVQARRDVVITARELADFEGIYRYLDARKSFDITPVQIAATKADLELARADFVQRRANVFDMEDRLIAVMNDPGLNLADDVELIPQDFFVLERIAVDRLAEAQAALDNRTEIKEQQIRVASAKIEVGRARNAELPRFDATFQVAHDGLDANADRSFDEVSRRKFISYVVAVEFEVPVGNRGPRAVRRRAELQHDQAMAQLKKTFEDVILDVNLAARKLDTTYDRIFPTFESVEARDREVASIVARAERKDHNTLISELGARRGLASTRRGMLQSLVDYNLAIVDLERSKGTLLRYNNVVIPGEAD